jgi:hypothetical protein
MVSRSFALVAVFDQSRSWVFAKRKRDRGLITLLILE